MDRKLILAVAGAGKTSFVIDQVCSSGKALVLTYTDNNFGNVRNRLISRCKGFPEGARVYTYFRFLYSFCLRPLCGDKYGFCGITFERPPERTRLRKDLRHYKDPRGRIYHSRMAKFLIKYDLIDQVAARIQRYFDSFYVDEVQDFGGYDLNFLLQLVASMNAPAILVGDFFQHTYDTSRDGNVNRSLYDDYTVYVKRFLEAGFQVDTDSLGSSHRCSPTICDFVSREVGVAIGSHQEVSTSVQFISSQERAVDLFHDDNIVKLFYSSHSAYSCFSNNWGASKGMDSYDSVCVVLNAKTEVAYRKRDLINLPPSTRNKLYVACTRARQDLYLVPERFIKQFKVK